MKYLQNFHSKKNYRLSLLVLAGLLLFFALSGFTSQQESDFSVHISRPAEGETYYAGPTSLQYSIPVSGWVSGYGDAPEDIVVQLEIIKEGVVVESGQSSLKPDNTFLFYVNVNPDASEGRFPPEAGACAFSCHTQASLNLPAGDLVVRVTAENPDGQSVETEVNFTVDRSFYATIPVQVLLAAEVDAPLEDIPVQAVTRLYMWRTRLTIGTTGAEGAAQIRAEILAEAPTDYILRVEPVVVNGVYYEGVEPVDVTVQPDGQSVQPVTLLVRAQKGQISGRINIVSPNDNQIQDITALSLSTGERMTSEVSAAGEFMFSDIPVDRYLLLLDSEMLAANHQQAELPVVDLSSQVQVSADIQVFEAQGKPHKGTITAEDGTWLPFSWIQEQAGSFFAVSSPADGSFSGFGTPAGSDEWVVSAPGYYSKQVSPEVFGQDDEIGELALEPQPETRVVPCGEGEVVVPAESLAGIDADLLTLESGWLWGECKGIGSVRIRVRSQEILVEGGRFAVEFLPYQREWLYLFSGEAVVRDFTAQTEYLLEANTMVNLTPRNEVLIPLHYDSTVVSTLTPLYSAPLEIQWKPTVIDQIQNQAAKLGVGTAKAITFVTYSVVLLSLVLVPAVILYQRWRRKK